MKYANLPAGFPATADEWERLIAQAPEHVQDADCPYDPNDPVAVERYWRDAVFVPGGGYPAVQAALAQHRRTRGPQKTPRKIPTTIRFDPDVLTALRATGKGWQTRVNQAMREWLQQR